MTALVAAETVLIALLVVLVAGLLRSHAEILRRLHELEEGGGAVHGEELLDETLAPARPGVIPAPPIEGVTLSGDTARVGFAPGTESLVAFLTSGCSVCRELWTDIGIATQGPLVGIRVVVVAKDRKLESLSKLRRLAPEGVAVVLSSAAWEAFDVPASPYFVHVGRDGAIAGEGVSATWDGVGSLLVDARADLAADETFGDGASRMRRAEDELEKAGLGPGDPSLYGDVTRDAA